MIKIHDEVDFGLKLNIGKWCTDGIKVGYRSDLRIFHDPLLKDSRSSAIIENNADISADTDIIIPNWMYVLTNTIVSYLLILDSLFSVPAQIHFLKKGVASPNPNFNSSWSFQNPLSQSWR